MTAYLAYSYSIGLTKEQQTEIDKRVNKSQEEFSRGFRTGIQISLSIYTVYSFAVASAYAADTCPDPAGPPQNNGNNGAVQPVPDNTPKPGFKPLSDGSKGAFVGGASAICGAALQSGDFALGVACAVLLVIGGIIINRPHD